MPTSISGAIAGDELKTSSLGDTLRNANKHFWYCCWESIGSKRNLA
jgi:hypothetical protein